MIAEPVFTWNLFITIVIVPFGLFLVYTGIKRLLDKKDKKEIEKDLKIAELSEKNEKLKEAANIQARQIITDKIEVLHDEIIADRVNTRAIREEIIDKLEVMDTTLKLINGSVQGCKQDIALHKQDVNAHSGD